MYKYYLIPFFCVFILDSISYLTGFHFGLSIPIGFFGYVTGVVLFFKNFKIESGFILFYFWLFVFLIWYNFVVFFSVTSELSDLFYSVKVLGYIGVGGALALYVKKVKKNSHVFNSLLLAAMVFTTYLSTEVFSVGVEDFNYLRVADAVALSGYFLLSRIESKLFNHVFFVAISIALFILGSRFSFFTFLSVYMLVVFTVGYNFRGRAISILLLAIVVVNIAPLAEHWESGGRIINLLLSPTDDSSFSARKTLNDVGENVIATHFFTGDFGYYRVEGNAGGYIHNFQSYTADFGVVGLLFSFVIFFYLVKLLYNYVIEKDTVSSFLPLCFILYALIGFLFAKSWNYYALFFCLGFAINFYSNKPGAYVTKLRSNFVYRIRN